jgi:hypothetical protein
MIDRKLILRLVRELREFPEGPQAEWIRKPLMTDHPEQEITVFMRRQLVAYALTGQPMGDFAMCCLTGKPTTAAAMADESNIETFWGIFAWIAERLPTICYGDGHTYRTWLEAHRLYEKGKLDDEIERQPHVLEPSE